MNTQDENQDTIQTSARTPFPEPQTIPSGWDTSAFLCDPQPASDERANNLAESESE